MHQLGKNLLQIIMESEEKIGRGQSKALNGRMFMQMNYCNSQFLSVPPIPSFPCSTSSWDSNTTLHRSVMDIIQVRTVRIYQTLVTVLRDIIPEGHVKWKKKFGNYYNSCRVFGIAECLAEKGLFCIGKFAVSDSLQVRK